MSALLPEEPLSALLDQLSSLPGRTRSFDPRHVQTDSPAERDLSSFPGDTERKYFLGKLVERASVSLALTGEIVQGVARLLRPPLVGETPAVLLRSGFESASLVDWLCGDSLTAEERVRRGVAIERNDYNRQVGTLTKIADGFRDTRWEEKAGLAVAGVGSLADKTSARAKEAGIKLVAVPTGTNRVKKMLSGSPHYALYSDVVHDGRSGPRIVASRSLSSDDRTSHDVVQQAYVELAAVTYLFASTRFIAYVSDPESLAYFRDGIGDLSGGLVRSADKFWPTDGGSGSAT